MVSQMILFGIHVNNPLQARVRPSSSLIRLLSKVIRVAKITEIYCVIEAYYAFCCFSSVGSGFTCIVLRHIY